MTSGASDETIMVECQICLQPVNIVALQTSHYDGACPGPPEQSLAIAVSRDEVTTRGRAKTDRVDVFDDDFLNAARWSRRKVMSESKDSLLSPGQKRLRSKAVMTSVNPELLDVTLDALLNNLDQLAIDSLKLLASQSIELPREVISRLISGITSESSSWPTSVMCFIAANELLLLDPLLWVPLDPDWNYFSDLLLQVISTPHEYVKVNSLVSLQKRITVTKLYVTSFHRDIALRKQEGSDCRTSILRRQVEFAASRRRIPLSGVLDELSQVYLFAQLAINDEGQGLVPRELRLEIFAIAETFQRSMNNSFPEM